MALIVLQTLQIPGESRSTDWLFSANLPVGANIGLKPVGVVPGSYGAIGYASLVYQIAGESVIYPSQAVPVFQDTLAMVFYPYVAAQPNTFNPYPCFLGVHLYPWITGGSLQVIQDTTTVYLARF